MNPYEFLTKFSKFGNKGGFKPGLERVKKVLSYFDNPQDKVDYIHVGGSNGKGSTVAFLNSILKNAGYKVGRYVSPPMIHFNERFSINDNPISTKELESIVDMLNEYLQNPETQVDFDEPSFFEIITIIAFIYFYRKNVDIGILEVGLGGRLDATNVIKKPLVSVITNISYEHADILGPKIEDIAYEKAGIIKENRPVITASNNSKVIKVFEKFAREKNSELTILNIDDKYKVIDKNLDYQILDLQLDGISYKDLKLKILGTHQIYNSVLALKTLGLLPARYIIDKKSIYSGLYACRWPGRLEVVNRNPDIILDGAHNEDGMKILVRFLKENVDKHKKIIFLISILKDKNYTSMLKMLKSLDNDIELLITTNQNKRSLDPKVIADQANMLNIKNKVIYNLYDSVKEAKKILNSSDLLCITGSLYTVSEARFYQSILFK
jgi:dihydrofolate synthase/folylpolyglutamate synthase